MSLTYPIAVPSGIAWTRLTMTPRSATARAASPFTGQTTLNRWPGQWWEVMFVSMPLTRTLAGRLAGFGLQLMSGTGTFYFQDPCHTTPDGALGGTPVIDGAGQTGNSVAVRGATASVAGWLLAGDYVQIGTGYHKLTQDADTDGFGKVTLEIFPALRDSPADGDSVITTGAKGVFQLADSVDWSLAGIMQRGMTFRAVEAF